jgi:hypothetical protein
VTFASVDNRLIGRFIGLFLVDHNLFVINKLFDSQASSLAANLAGIVTGSCDSVDAQMQPPPHFIVE